MAKGRVGGTFSVELDNTGGTLINISAFVDTISAVGDQVQSLDVTAFTDSAERIIAGLRASQEFTLSGAFDDAGSADALMAPLVGTIGTVRVGPFGTATGKRRFQGECLAMFYRVTGEVKGRVNYEMGFKLDSSMTVGTF